MAFILYFVGLLLATQVGFASTLDNRPDLYFDGEIFAARLFAQICENPNIYHFSQYGPDPIAPLRGYLGLPYWGLEKKDMQALTQWATEQEANSIYPDMLYRKAIEITNGNVNVGLRLVWNFLSADWENKKKVVEKPWYSNLVDITGEKDLVKELYKYGPNGKAGTTRWPVNSTGKVASRGGNYSSWYHFSGTGAISLNGVFSIYNIQPFAVASCKKAQTFADIGRLSTNVMLAIEHYGSNYKFVDPFKRENIDKAGSKFGSELAKHLILGKSNPSYCAYMKKYISAEYLTDRPDIYGPKWHLKPGQMPYEYKVKREY